MPALRAALGLVLVASVLAPAAACAWRAADVRPRVDNLGELLRGCEQRRAMALERWRLQEAWAAHLAATGQGDGVAGAPAVATGPGEPPEPKPPCSSERLTSRLGARPPGVWALVPAEGGRLYATVNLPLPALLVSTDGGASWHFRHVFAPGYNLDRGMLLRGLDYQAGLLAVASDRGLLLSRDGGLGFTTVLAGRSLTAVAISPHDPAILVTGGEGTSLLSVDGGAQWTDLGFHAFTRRLATRNRHLTDHITSIELDPLDAGTVYVGTGSHLYRYLRGDGAEAPGRWQVMEGDAQGRVHDDSTVYNVEIGSRFMISTCNGVYYLARRGADAPRDQADVSWRKFQAKAFSERRVGGPKGNLRSYFVAEDPGDPGHVLIADFAALYEGRAVGKEMSWRRVDDLPTYSPGAGYPEYTAIAWTGGGAVVGSRYRGIFIEARQAAARPGGGGASCFLR